jgi:hypothetical protein
MDISGSGSWWRTRSIITKDGSEVAMATKHGEGKMTVSRKMRNDQLLPAVHQYKGIQLIYQ